LTLSQFVLVFVDHFNELTGLVRFDLAVAILEIELLHLSLPREGPMRCATRGLGRESKRLGNFAGIVEEGIFRYQARRGPSIANDAKAIWSPDFPNKYLILLA
jgi:hypothetical protein